MCTGEKTQYTQGSVLFVVSDIHWGPLKIFPMDEGGLLYIYSTLDYVVQSRIPSFEKLR